MSETDYIEKVLPGERHEFKELRTGGGARDLTPPQHLDERGNVTSARKHEVSHLDPQQAKIKELEARIKELEKEIKRLTETNPG